MTKVSFYNFLLYDVRPIEIVSLLLTTIITVVWLWIATYIGKKQIKLSDKQIELSKEQLEFSKWLFNIESYRLEISNIRQRLETHYKQTHTTFDAWGIMKLRKNIKDEEWQLEYYCKLFSDTLQQRNPNNLEHK
jgi:hypothetical protein